MVFWIVIAALTAAVTAALLAPLFRSPRAAGGTESEVAIYRDQLNELEREVERGVLPEAEAKAARAEIARRLIQAAEASDRKGGDQPARRRQVFWLAIVAVPLLCLGGYLLLGSPGSGDRPFDVRSTNPASDDLFARFDLFAANPTQQGLLDLERLVDQAVAEAPDNAPVLQVAAIVYLGAQRYDEATAAYNRYVELAGQDADPAGAFARTLGEAIVLSNGQVTPEAEDLFRRVVEANPADMSARLYLALALEERGQTDAAIAAYQELLTFEPVGGADWADLARGQLTQLGVEPPPPPTEGANDFVGLTPEQLEMVNQMVGGLAARLAEEPNDPEGWAQLIRSYMVLERLDDAEAALAQAREIFTGNAEATATIETVAAELARALELE